jgi:hypothetical protein
MLLNPFFEPNARVEDNEFDDDNETYEESTTPGGVNSEHLLTFKLKLDELVAYYQGQL